MYVVNHVSTELLRSAVALWISWRRFTAAFGIVVPLYRVADVYENRRECTVVLFCNTVSLTETLELTACVVYRVVQKKVA